MKNLKNILAALAFVFAIGASFAFAAPKEALSFDAKKKIGCTEVNAPAGCIVTSVGTPCTIDGSQLVDINDNCFSSDIYRQPF